MKYLFEHLNSGLEIEDPIIKILEDNITIFPSRMTIDVDVLLTTDKSKFGVRLYDVAVENLNYDDKIFGLRVMTKLKEFEIK